MKSSSGYQAFVPHRPAWGFPPASPALARRFRLASVPGWLASAASGNPSSRRRSCHRRPDYLDLPSPAAMLLSGFLAHILPPSVDSCWLGVRFHSSPWATQSLPPRIPGFTRQRRRKVQFRLDVLLLVVRETHGLLAAPSRSDLRSPFPARPIHCSAFRHSECLTSLADVMT